MTAGAACPTPSASTWARGCQPSYDSELKLLYIGTSVTSPAPKFLLGGNDKQHLYHNSTLRWIPRPAGSSGTTST